MILTSFVYAVHASALFQVTNISVTVTKFVPVCLVFLSVLKVQVFQKICSTRRRVILEQFYSNCTFVLFPNSFVVCRRKAPIALCVDGVQLCPHPACFKYITHSLDVSDTLWNVNIGHVKSSMYVDYA